ncbi:MAG TPA: hypothetical protein VEX41_08250 [Candidatus Eisenbacteria bacterium]|nr:hypothetical protein [Candidatus Eisenbacteria bacterium]
MERRHARKLAALVAAAILLLGVAVSPAFAVSGFGERPGHGYGDSRNEHSDGPPPMTGEDDWPGWGYGDSVHGHEDGPPGQNLED